MPTHVKNQCRNRYLTKIMNIIKNHNLLMWKNMEVHSIRHGFWRLGRLCARTENGIKQSSTMIPKPINKCISNDRNRIKNVLGGRWAQGRLELQHGSKWINMEPQGHLKEAQSIQNGTKSILHEANMDPKVPKVRPEAFEKTKKKRWSEKVGTRTSTLIRFTITNSYRFSGTNSWVLVV